VSLAYTFIDGVDAVEVGSYSNTTGSIVWTEVPAASAAGGLRVCGRAWQIIPATSSSTF
jgi:hypothetical protein